MRTALVPAALGPCLSACSSPPFDAVGQPWQKPPRRKIADLAERARCAKSAATSCERDQAEVDTAKKAR